MMHKLALVMLILLALGALPAPALAQGGCYPFGPSSDMVGPYAAPAPLPSLAVDRCGMVTVVWDDDRGLQRVRYVASGRIAGGGFTAYAESDDGPYLDGVRFLLVKPAEPGYIQVVTMDPYGNVFNVYRLARIT